MIYKLLPENHEMLFQEMPEFDFENPPCDPEQLALDLIETMRENEGIGLSANQVGLPYRVFVMEGDPAFVCFNPKVVAVGKDLVKLQEGCLSYPNFWIDIKRPAQVKVRFATPSGAVTTKTFDEWHARCFLHELDHLNGRPFYKNATNMQIEAARKLRTKITRNMKRLGING